MTLEPATILAATAVFVAAGMVKGALGLGLPTIGMGLLSLFLPPPAAATLLFLPSFLTNAWQAVEAGSVLPLVRRLWPMLAASFVATVACTPLIAHGAPAVAGGWLGVALVLYGVTGLLGWRFPVPDGAERPVGVAVGIATGVVTGATGVFVLPAVPFLAGIGLERDRLVQAMGLSFTASTLGLGLGLWLNGAVAPGAAGFGALAILPALAGMRIGSALRARISPALFRRLFFLLLMGLGAHGILKSLALIA